MRYLIVFFSIIILLLGGIIYIKKINNRKKYNVIVISVDLLKARSIEQYIQSKKDIASPFYAFLSESYAFLNAISPSSWTRPTISSIITSLYPSETGMAQKHFLKNSVSFQNSSTIPLPKILKKYDYTTIAFTDGGAYDQKFGFSQGFDVYYNATQNSTYNKKYGLDNTIPKIIIWLKKNKNTPFFLFLQTFDMHNASLDYLIDQHPELRNKLNTVNGLSSEFLDLEKKIRENRFQPTKEQVNFWEEIYNMQFLLVKKKLELLLEELRSQKLLENSIIILTSAHGQEIFEHGKLGHGTTLYNELIHVPLAIHLPGQKQGKKIEDLVSTLDIMPTILSFLNIPKTAVPQRMKGIDLTPSFYGKDVSHEVYSETDLFLPEKLSIQTKDRWKLIVDINKNQKILSKELYNINEDPAEMQNALLSNRKKTYEMEIKILQYIKDTSP